MQDLHRTWTKPQRALDFDELAYLLCSRTWPLSTAFSMGCLTLRNTSASTESAQEYTVLRDGQEIDAITVSTIRDCRRLSIYLQSLTWLIPLHRQSTQRALSCPAEGPGRSPEPGAAVALAVPAQHLDPCDGRSAVARLEPVRPAFSAFPAAQAQRRRCA